MYSKILIIHFPVSEVQKPWICALARDFDLTFNILNATIYPRKEGMIVIELSGQKRNFKEGVKFLKKQGIKVQNASQEIKRDESVCTHCGACTAVCPTGALSVQRPGMLVEFNQTRCSVCELCITACPPRAMHSRPMNGGFFE